MDLTALRKTEFNSTALNAVLNIVAHLISPILFIWAVNTLFGCGIAYSFQTWLAGFVIVVLLRFHLRGSENSCEPFEDFDDDFSVDDFYDDPFMDREERKAKMKANLIAYPNRGTGKNSSPEGSN